MLWGLALTELLRARQLGKGQDHQSATETSWVEKNHGGEIKNKIRSPTWTRAYEHISSSHEHITQTDWSIKWIFTTYPARSGCDVGGENSYLLIESDQNVWLNRLKQTPTRFTAR